MTTAHRTSSVSGRLRTLALAGSLALGTMFPVAAVVWADAGDPVVVDPTTADVFDISGEGLSGRTAVIAGGGDGANLRSGPAHDAEVVTTIPDGVEVDLRIDELDTVYDADGVTRWWPVGVGDTRGWVSGFLLADASSADDVDSDPSKEPVESTATAPVETAEPVLPDTTTPPFPVGSTAVVGTGDGFSVTLRAAGSPTAEVVGNLSDGQTVEILSGPVSFEGSETGWFEVTVQDLTGFVDGDLLTAAADLPPVTPVPATAIATTVATTEPDQETSATTTPAEPDEGETPPSTAPASDETEEPAVTAVPTEPEPGDESETPIPGDTTDPEVTPETDPDGEDAAGSTGFIYPLENYRRTQGFGCSSLGFYPYNPDFGCAVHDGLDLAAPSGTPLLASADGEVVAAGWCDCGLGYYVEIDHGEGVHTVYGHMASQPYVSTGQQVQQGEVIGPLGSTGISTGPHVHFMIRVNGVAQNPESYLP
ncbi:MAG TPA: peptidoglycan DD-metalloendopeptidase family protein [Thermomicrobiales bacterium]|nr:peptidoglycan DD-metalloendopeptidase family protein [Thermomicrobiales bacterium]